MRDVKKGESTRLCGPHGYIYIVHFRESDWFRESKKKKKKFLSIVVHVKYDLRKFSKYYEDALPKMSSFNKILLRRHSIGILLGTGDVAVNKTRSLPWW